MSIELIYWDSATFLAYFQQEPGRVDLCRGTLERAEAGEVGIVTSTLSIAECLWLRGSVAIPRNRAPHDFECSLPDIAPPILGQSS
jgi:predicted nucleic acid-binding protein